MKLRYIRPLGRYKNLITGQEYNVKTGRRMSRGTDHKYYLCRGTRHFISDQDFYQNHKKVEY